MQAYESLKNLTCLDVITVRNRGLSALHQLCIYIDVYSPRPYRPVI